MSREIKFRAWSKDLSRMIYEGFELVQQDDPYYNFCFTGSYEIQKPNGGVGDWVSLDLMQYTGLKDRNGKEIYEGDIIETRLDRGIVDFYLCAFSVSFDNPDWPRRTLSYFREICEVIGNIHENPELLKEKAK